MKTAWIITREGLSHPCEVIGILSARKSSKVVRGYLEWLCALLDLGPREHLSIARYTNPDNPYPAQCWQTNTGVPIGTKMTCGHHPFLVARLAHNLVLDTTDTGEEILNWTEPDRPICDEDTGRIVGHVPGQVVQAPVRLPFNLHQRA